MNKIITLLSAILYTAPLFAASGGPDQYGYTWKDSNEPSGPVYGWIDITGTGTLVQGLQDDNTSAALLLNGVFNYYWYPVDKIYVGSNGYLVLNDYGSIASPFPNIPDVVGADNYVAGFMTDLNFVGVNNPGECWWQDDNTRTVISFVNVPYYAGSSPFYSGANSFQFVLDKTDSTITINFQSTPCCAFSNGPFCGIEDATGTLGLEQNAGNYPASGTSVRFYPPAVPLLEITDARVQWVGAPGTAGLTLALGGAAVPIGTSVQNSGSEPITGCTVTCEVLDASNQVISTDVVPQGPLAPGQTEAIAFPTPFVPLTVGTYRAVVTITGIPGETVLDNNSYAQELVVYDTSLLNNEVDWAGPLFQSDISPIGDDSGFGAYIVPPSYPSYVSHTTCRIAANNANAGFVMKVYDDDGPNNGPGTLLDSVLVSSADGQAGDHDYPLNTPFMLTSGGLYVMWYQFNAQSVFLALDISPPFSLRSYEVFQGVWGEHRQRETSDFHLGLRMGQVPLPDAGCLTLDQPADGQQVVASTPVQMWLRNFGNAPLTGVPCGYRFSADPPVLQTYNGAAIAPGDSALFSFAQPLVPVQNESGSFCVWSSYPDDVLLSNDTLCISISTVVGVEERSGHRLRVAPVPASSLLRVEGLSASAERLEVFDMIGALRYVHPLRPGVGAGIVPVDDLPEGVYLLRVVMLDGELTERFVVER